MFRHAMVLKRAAIVVFAVSLITLYLGCGGGSSGSDSSSSSESTEDPTGFADTWRIVELDGGYTCENPAYGNGEGGETETYTITISVDGDAATIVDNRDGETGTGTIDGNTIYVKVESTDDDGVLSTTIAEYTLSEDGQTLTAEGTWTEVLNDESECNGSFTLSGTRV